MPRHSSSPKLAIVAAALILTALACQLPGASSPATSTPAGISANPTQTGGTPAPTQGGVAATAGPVAVEITFGPGAFDLPDPAIGLADLTSYRATLVQSFEGTRNEQPLQWSRTTAAQVNRPAAARQLSIETTGSAANRELWAEVRGALFERHGDEPCRASALEGQGSMAEWNEPVGFLPGLIGAEAAGAETISGVAAEHYTFDQRAFGSLGPAQSKGEVWVAAQGGIVLHYLLATTGGADYFGEGLAGTLTTEYTLTEANQPQTVEAPADCPAGLVDAPSLADATDVVNIPGLLTYSTGSSTLDAGAFYQENLPALGWQPLPEPTLDESLVLLDFVRADEQLSIIITADEAGTAVQLVLGPAK